ncbi:helix-turn-helix domain-containing protein [Nocardia sp. CS682]|uniref:helix-turn-helix domain-containing protein n=1 Tax=Nocardia sp. CS682 TaxID=1047172 RepID=UPI0010751366|nr:helix-turn-helix domain-containing protein [Nocardia sp. CS682]QBS44430.1 transcriptional regulator [Nocardia sp. CS682]
MEYVAGGADIRVNPWVALRPDEDAEQVSTDVSAAHESFVERGETPGSVRQVVEASWVRSRGNGIDPDRQIGRTSLAGIELERYRRTHPMSSVRPVVQTLLVEDARDTGLLIALSDAHGRLLWVEGDSAARDRAAEMNFVDGADWSEAAVGTNAPGTALALDHCVQIFGAEHYSRMVHPWSCAAGPVHDPATGRILGAIDITGGPRVAAPEVLSLIRATVAVAESELRAHPITIRTTPRVELLGTNPALLFGNERIPLSRRHSEILLLLMEHPEGLGTEHIAVLLDERDLDAVTVRAEISRLRRILGGTALGSRPYRLLTELDSDVGELRRSLRRGDIGAAVARYRGQLLPASRAPGVGRAREALRARMRAAVLTSRDPAILGWWISSVDGREDRGAWSAYLASLEPDSSLYAQVAAQLAMLDRELGRSQR